MKHAMGRTALLALCLPLLLAGCGGEETAQAVPQEEIWAQVEQQLGSSLPSLMPVEEEQLEQLYGIGDDEIEDFELHMAMMNVQADEILFARVKSGQMETVKKAIEERAKQLDEQWSTYLPDQHELVKNYILEEKGDYVCFLIGTQADKIETIWEESITQQ